MNREILFRGKRVEDGQWVEGWYCGKTCDTLFSKARESAQIIDEDVLYWHEVIPSTVGQFTGLTDKNGVRIFEGDILQFRSGIYYVAWDDKHSKFLQIDNDFSRELHIAIETSEVIGNIHDDPELMGGDINV